MKAELVFDAQAQLGEGALWHADTHQLYWVDIEGRKLHLYTPGTNENRTIEVGERIGTVVPSISGKAIVALQNGIFELDLSDESLTLVTNPLEDTTDMRFNDGKCDPAGRFWVGSMHLSAQKANAALYRMDPDLEVTRMLDNVTISNGITWSLDGQTMYYIDTPTGVVRAFDFHVADGTFERPRVAVEIPEDTGHPDGMTIDEEGMLWVAHWGGGSVGRWNPENGKLIDRIDLPASKVTSCAFGGDNLDTLYITTARKDLDEQELNRYPHSGGLFAAKPNVSGITACAFGVATEL